MSCGHTLPLQKLYHVAGVEGKPVVFLLTDTQISKESFLEDVNNLLNSGEVPGMYAPEDKERILAGIRDWLLTQGAPTAKVRFTWCSSMLSRLHCVACHQTPLLCGPLQHVAILSCSLCSQVSGLNNLSQHDHSARKIDGMQTFAAASPWQPATLQLMLGVTDTWHACCDNHMACLV